MRLLHTSDWHLGQSLHEVSRELEQTRFLTWLLDTLEAERADALLVCGDVFDSANPPPWAQRAYYELLASCRRRPAARSPGFPIYKSSRIATRRWRSSSLMSCASAT